MNFKLYLVFNYILEWRVCLWKKLKQFKLSYKSVENYSKYNDSSMYNKEAIVKVTGHKSNSSILCQWNKSNSDGPSASRWLLGRCNSFSPQIDILLTFCAMCAFIHFPMSSFHFHFWNKLYQVDVYYLEKLLLNLFRISRWVKLCNISQST